MFEKIIKNSKLFQKNRPCEIPCEIVQKNRLRDVFLAFMIPLFLFTIFVLPVKAIDYNQLLRDVSDSSVSSNSQNASFSPNGRSWTNDDVSVTINIDTRENSVVEQWRYRLSNDEGSSYDAWTEWNPSRRISLAGEGKWKIEVLIEYKDGNSNTFTSGIYNIDKTPPTPPQISFGERDNGERTLILDGGADQQSGLRRYRYRISTDWGETWERLRAYYNERQISPDVNAIWARSVDNADNVSEVIIHIDDKEQQNKPSSINLPQPYVGSSLILSFERVETAENGYEVEVLTSAGIGWKPYDDDVEQTRRIDPQISIPEDFIGVEGSVIQFRVRAKETDDYLASDFIETPQRTVMRSTQIIPPAPSMKSVKSDEIELEDLGEDVEYKKDDGNWQDSTKFENLSPGTEYTFYARRIETENTMASPASSAVLKTERGTQDPPEAPTALAISTSSITLNNLEAGIEVRLEEGEWTTNTEFRGLEPETAYTFYARRAETPSLYPSLSSEGGHFVTQSIPRPSFDGQLQVNDILKLGSDLYEVVKVGDNESVLVALDLVESRNFDNVTNNWQDSSLRRYLNEVYFERLSSVEQSAILPLTHPYVLGDTDKIRLLHDEDLSLLDDRKKSDEYWTMIPILTINDENINEGDIDRNNGSSNDRKVIVVDEEGNLTEVIGRRNLGVVPVVTLQAGLSFIGEGTNTNPYLISDGLPMQTRPEKPPMKNVIEGEDRLLEWTNLQTATNGYDIEILITSIRGDERSIMEESTNNRFRLDKSLFVYRNWIQYRIRAKNTNSNGYSDWSLFSNKVMVGRVARRTNDLEVGEFVEIEGELYRVEEKLQNNQPVLSNGELLKLGEFLDYIKVENQENYYKLRREDRVISNEDLIKKEEVLKGAISNVLEDQKSTKAEKNRVLLQYLVENDRSLYTPPASVDMRSKIFLLSMDELNQFVIKRVLDKQEGWDENDYQKKLSDPLKDKLTNSQQTERNPLMQRALKSIVSSDYWRYWLRTPKGDTKDQVLTVTEDSKVGYYNSQLEFGGVAPAMIINLKDANLEVKETLDKGSVYGLRTQ